MQFPKVLSASLLTLVSIAAFGQPSAPIKVMLDLTDAPRKFLHAQLSIPVTPGELTLVYPQWIPGEHSPTGPIDNFAGLKFFASGQEVPWRRDEVNMFAFHVTVPPGVTTLEATADFLATAAASGFSAGASTSANLAMVSWNEVVLYPANTPSDDVQIEGSLKLPDGWKYGTALTTASQDGNTVHFQPVPLSMFVDSPVLAGRFFKEIPLAEEITPKHYMDMAADGPEDLEVGSDELAAFSNLIRETGALYQSRHYNSYHFLLTLSDQVAHFGLEHHQSSDDRVDARNFLDEDLELQEGDLLPHEFTHSWNGKYRRPAGLATGNYHQPMKGGLLWVYEGMTQYLGDVLAARSGIWTADEYKAYLAASAAELDHRPGRTWRDLQDTAVAAQILYSTTDGWDNWRRSVDYYGEGELVWLEADTTIRTLSGGKKSLNDFCAKFLGTGGDTAPKVLPYTFEDIVSSLNAIQPYDWGKFFHERLTSKSPRAPLGGIAAAGYRIDYTAESNRFIRASESTNRGVNAWYSLGLHVGADETLDDVLVDSLAFKAGLGPGMRIIAVNGRRCTDELLHSAIRDSKSSSDSIELIVDNTGFVKVIKLDYHGGEKYPHLVKEEGRASMLDDIIKPLAKSVATPVAKPVAAKP